MLGASGMLGNTIFRVLSYNQNWEVFGTVRSREVKSLFNLHLAEHVLKIEDIQSDDTLLKLFDRSRPSVAINCISLPRELMQSGDALTFVPIFSLLPHRLAAICRLTGTRLVHISTDAVYSGKKGGYREEDPPDADDLYGRAKTIGELHEPHTFTIRTSLIGHELRGSLGLLGWFLAQKESCTGYGRAVFSGLPTVILAEIIRDIVIARPDLYGIYHIAAQPISKFDLLTMIAKTYEKAIEIKRDDSVVIDRSLNSQRFNAATGYVAPEWSELIQSMHADWHRLVNRSDRAEVN